MKRLVLYTSVLLSCFISTTHAQHAPNRATDTALPTYTTNINLDELNTAAESGYMQPAEREMIREVNYVRKYPKAYAAIVAEYLNEKKLHNDISKEEYKVGEELIAELMVAPSLSLLHPKECIYTAASSHGNYQKKMNNIGHAGYNNLHVAGRLKITCGSAGHCGENLVAGEASVRESLISLLIDYGIQSRGHRQNILNPDWRYIACHLTTQVGDFTNSWVQNFTDR